jgi:hypothetical protein
MFKHTSTTFKPLLQHIDNTSQPAYTKIYEKALNKYPMIIIPADTMDTKIAKSLGFTTLLSIIMEGSDRLLPPS